MIEQSPQRFCLDITDDEMEMTWLEDPYQHSRSSFSITNDTSGTILGETDANLMSITKSPNQTITISQTNSSASSDGSFYSASESILDIDNDDTHEHEQDNEASLQISIRSMLGTDFCNDSSNNYAFLEENLSIDESRHLITSTPLTSDAIPTPSIALSPVRSTPPSSPIANMSLDSSPSNEHSNRMTQQTGCPDKFYELLTDREKVKYNAYWQAYHKKLGSNKPMQKMKRPSLGKLLRNPFTGEYDILRIVKIFWNMGIKFATCTVRQPDGYVLVNIATMFLVKAAKFNHLFETYYKQQNYDLRVRRRLYTSDPRIFIGTIFEREMLEYCKSKNIQFDEHGLPPERDYRRPERRLINPL